MVLFFQSCKAISCWKCETLICCLPLVYLEQAMMGSLCPQIPKLHIHLILLNLLTWKREIHFCRLWCKQKLAVYPHSDVFSTLTDLMASPAWKPKNLTWFVTCWLLLWKNVTGMLVSIPFTCHYLFHGKSKYLFSLLNIWILDRLLHCQENT